jgi:non-ribosomal peptide synthetase component F
VTGREPAFKNLDTSRTAGCFTFLAAYTGRRDVVFGRPPELDGVESTVGLFINTVPADVNYPPARIRQ